MYEIRKHKSGKILRKKIQFAKDCCLLNVQTLCIFKIMTLEVIPVYLQFLHFFLTFVEKSFCNNNYETTLLFGRQETKHGMWIYKTNIWNHSLIIVAQNIYFRLMI